MVGRFVVLKARGSFTGSLIDEKAARDGAANT
jgi:hypothetical protein